MDDQGSTPFPALGDAEFMQLTTFRASGEGVPTTVWFAPEAGHLYVTTIETTGKVKRIRRTPRVTVAPSDRIGTTSGPVAEGSARVLDESEFALAEGALKRKYGLKYNVLTLGGLLSKRRVFLEVTPA